MDPLMLALLVVAAALAGVELIESRGRSLLCWSILAMAVALMVPLLA